MFYIARFSCTIFAMATPCIADPGKNLLRLQFIAIFAINIDCNVLNYCNKYCGNLRDCNKYWNQIRYCNRSCADIIEIFEIFIPISICNISSLWEGLNKISGSQLTTTNYQSIILFTWYTTRYCYHRCLNYSNDAILSEYENNWLTNDTRAKFKAIWMYRGSRRMMI